MRAKIIDGVVLAVALLGALLPADMAFEKEIIPGSLVYLWTRISSLAPRFGWTQVCKTPPAQMCAATRRDV
jgi:hypothetical protein